MPPGGDRVLRALIASRLSYVISGGTGTGPYIFCDTTKVIMHCPMAPENMALTSGYARRSDDFPACLRIQGEPRKRGLDARSGPSRTHSWGRQARIDVLPPTSSPHRTCSTQQRHAGHAAEAPTGRCIPVGATITLWAVSSVAPGVRIILSGWQRGRTLVPRVDPAANRAGIPLVQTFHEGTATTTGRAGDFRRCAHGRRVPPETPAAERRQTTSRSSGNTRSRQDPAQSSCHSSDSSSRSPYGSDAK